MLNGFFIVIFFLQKYKLFSDLQKINKRIIEKNFHPQILIPRRGCFILNNYLPFFFFCESPFV